MPYNVFLSLIEVDTCHKMSGAENKCRETQCRRIMPLVFFLFTFAVFINDIEKEFSTCMLCRSYSSKTLPSEGALLFESYPNLTSGQLYC